MDVNLPETSGPGVDELVGYASGHNYDLLACDLERGVAYGEGRIAFLYHEYLIVGMGVKFRATSLVEVH